MAWMQCAERVQCQQAKSLFHDVVTDLLVCQSLEAAFGDGRFRLCVTREAIRFGEWGVGLVSASRVADPGRSGTPPGFSAVLGGQSGGIAALNPRLPSWAPPGQSFVKPEVVGDGDAGWTNRSSQTGHDLSRDEIPGLENGATVAP